MPRMIAALLLMTLAVSACVVDGGYGGRGYGGRQNAPSDWGEHGGYRQHEDNVRYRNWER